MEDKSTSPIVSKPDSQVNPELTPVYKYDSSYYGPCIMDLDVVEPSKMTGVDKCPEDTVVGKD